MGELILGAPVAGLTSRKRIVADDVLMLRRDVFRDGVVSRGEAESLLALDASCEDKCPEWNAFFVEALLDYLVHQEKPAGHVSEENADWLIRAISSDGKVDTASELELLVRVLETARSAPDRLTAFALSQVAVAVIEGEGVLARRRGALKPGAIMEAEVELLRRILHAGGGADSLGISRAEAEVLFHLNDRTAHGDNHPSWDDLFVKALANHMMCVSGYTPPTRQEALRRERFLDESEAGIGQFFSRMVSGGLSGILSAYRREDGAEAWHRSRNGRLEAETEAAERIDDAEAHWLAERIGRDGLFHRNEAALLVFLRQESPQIHPLLRPLLDRVA